MMEARRLRVTGIVQGVGFRPFVARQAEAHHLSGWVLNAGHGVEIHVEGPAAALEAFEAALRVQSPPAARISAIDSSPVPAENLAAFRIRESERRGKPTAWIPPDLAVCHDCVLELFDPGARRFGYPYVNCTNCGPRYSILRALPYDRERTAMASWTLCAACASEYGDGHDRRFHAEPIACPSCGPGYHLREAHPRESGPAPAIARAAWLLSEGAIVAVKGIGGYHLACDAANPGTLQALRERKHRQSRPFAVMARDINTVRALADVDDEATRLLTSRARPIVLLPARVPFPDVAPDSREIGVMLPYAPVHHLLFAAGAPDVLVMTSGNRSNEPMVFEEADAVGRLGGVADAFLIGERPIVRRIDDSIVRPGSDGPILLRRGRGLAPAVVARLPATGPILALGADLKNTVTLAIRGDALVSQHIGDLEYLGAREAYRATIRDLTAMYGVNWDDVLVVHDQHPHYASTAVAHDLPAASHCAVQHHRAHVASVLAERGALDTRVIGVAFDGAGYGDDGTIWGGEFFAGSVTEGLSRVASLHPFALPGGDAAARHPVQAAAGLLFELESLPDLTAPPFSFTSRYRQARELAHRGLRTFACTSAGRLFDAAAALLGFTRAIDYEGQAAAWLEMRASLAAGASALPFELTGAHVDFRPTLRAIIEGRRAGREEAVLARAFHETIAAGISAMIQRLCEVHTVDTVVLSGGTFQNALLVHLLRSRLSPVRLWLNVEVPPNDGGISLGQAALGAVRRP